MLRPRGYLLRPWHCLLGIVLTTTVCVEAQAQFNARGRSRQPSPSAGNAERRAQPSRPVAAASEDPKKRQEVLIDRYSKLILSSPGEEVPIKRLAELVRERDGNLNQLLARLAKDAETAQDKYPHLVAWGGLLAEDSQLEEAAKKVSAATELSPDRPEAWIVLSELETRLGRKDAAKKSLERALPLVSGPQKTITMRALRDLSLDQEDYEAAENYHEKLNQEAAGNVFLRGELGRELLRRGQTDRAVEQLRKVAESSRGDARAMAPAWRDLGMALLESEKFTKATEALSKASRLSVAQPGLRQEIDELLAEAHRQQGTINDFLEELETSARSAPRMELLGRLYEEEGRTDDAAAAYEKALRAAPSNLDIRLRLVRLLELTGDLEGASRQLGELVRRSPRDIHLALRQMELLLAQGRRKESLSEWDRLEKLAQSDPEAGLLLVDFAERLGEPERQKRLLARLARGQSRDFRYLVELGARFFREGQEEKARQIWNRIVSLHPSDSRAHVTLGEVLIDHEAVSDGVEALERAVELEPRSSRSRRALALGLERATTLASRSQKRHFEDRALEEWQAVLELSQANDSDKPLARRRIIRIEKRRGRLERRLAELERELRKSPDDEQKAHLLAEGYMSLNDYPRAIATLERLLEKRKGDRQALLQLEQAYTLASNHAAVIETLEKLVAADPARAREYYDRMAHAATRQRDFKGALRYAELAVKRNPSDPRANAQLGELYLSQGQTSKAEAAFRRALELDDRQHLVALSLAELLSQTKRTEQALPLLFHVVRTAQDPALVQRASRRALSMSVPAKKTEDLEDVLRPLAMGRSDQPVYRNLLLETLGAEFYPLHQAASFGDGKTKSNAVLELRDLADRSTQPLLSALAGSDVQAAQVAIDLLAYGKSKGAGQALVSFAEGAANHELRVRALLAAGRSPRQDLSERLGPFIFDDGVVVHGQLATAAAWALARQPGEGPVPLLMEVIEKGSPDMRAYAAFGLVDRSLTGSTERQVTSLLVELIQNEASGHLARAAAALSLSQLLATSSQPHEKNFEEAVLSLQTLCSDRSSVAMRAALSAVSRIDRSATTKKLVASALFDQNPAVRETATVAAVLLVTRQGPQELLPHDLAPHQVGAETHLSKLLGRSLPTAATSKERFEAMVALEEALRTEALLALVSSPESALSALLQLQSDSGKAVLGHLLLESDHLARAPGFEQAKSVATRLRSALVDELLYLVESPHLELSLAALSLLRLQDGEAADAAIQNALTSTRELTFSAALQALAFSSTERAIELLSVMNGEDSWSRRRRRVVALGTIMNTTSDSSLAKRARSRIQAFQTDPSQLVRKTAEEELNTGGE